MNCELSDQARSGVHIWWLGDVRKFQQDYPEWSFSYDLYKVLQEIVQAMKERVRTQPS
jgi:CDP-paratose 2-epimerase